MRSLKLTPFIFAFLPDETALCSPAGFPPQVVVAPLHAIKSRISSLNATHATIVHHQYINHARQRYARIAGRPPLSTDVIRGELMHNLSKLPGAQDKYLVPSGVYAVTYASLDVETNDIGYTMPMHIGTPPQTFYMLMDSGSADTWVGDNNCKTYTGSRCRHKHLYHTNESTTLSKTNRMWSITYGSGSVTGSIVKESLSVGPLHLDQFSMGVVSSETAQFQKVEFDGICGCAKSSLSQQGNPTLIEALYRAGLIPQPIISFKLSRVRESGHGEVAFGGKNPRHYKPGTEVTVENVNSDGFYEARLDSIRVNGRDTGLKWRNAILDTGTTMVLFDRKAAQKIHGLIPGAEVLDSGMGWKVPCDTKAAIELEFGGKLFRIVSRDIALIPLDPDNPNEMQCISGIGIGDDMGPGQILVSTSFLDCDEQKVGDVFLKSVYVTFNFRSNQITVAQAV
ncbi:hypothetical protein AX16_002357 [Volvariella volvacea WC 439]|nr:hypothetical protein AX16_002357 [Volvariella volvacea WC 439]